jgi:hypothetical protein
MRRLRRWLGRVIVESSDGADAGDAEHDQAGEDGRGPATRRGRFAVPPRPGLRLAVTAGHDSIVHPPRGRGATRRRPVRTRVHRIGQQGGRMSRGPSMYEMEGPRSVPPASPRRLLAAASHCGPGHQSRGPRSRCRSPGSSLGVEVSFDAVPVSGDRRICMPSRAPAQGLSVTPFQVFSASTESVPLSTGNWRRTRSCPRMHPQHLWSGEFLTPC